MSTDPKLLYLHRSLLIICAFLMCNPFWYLILSGVYTFLVISIWIFWKKDRKEKLIWTFVPIGIPTVIFALLLFVLYVVGQQFN